ncbi:MAG: glycosyltransferase family 39 protein [Chloroflexi bacterium]|nr:glycosyltransferase family 39 protein [Chloroflexota bacterium]
MKAIAVRGLLALLALALALAGQHFLEQQDSLATGLALLLLGGFALAMAYADKSPPFLGSFLDGKVRASSSTVKEFLRVSRAFPFVLFLLGLSLYRSASNTDDAMAWIFHVASIGFFIYLVLRPSTSGITGRLMTAFRRPSNAALVEGGLLMAILALAVSLRLLVLKDMPFGLWYDEAIHGMSAVKILEEGSYRPIFVPAANVASPMIYVQAASIWLLGRNTVALRLPSVLMDLGLIALLYLLTRRLLGRRIALVVAFLLAVSSWDITWARNAMPGVTGPFFGVASVLAFLWALKRNTLAAYAVAGVVLGSGIWYYQAIRIMPVAIIVIAGYAFYRTRPPLGEIARKFGIYVAGALLVAAPLLLYAVTHAEEFWRRAQVVTSSKTGSSLDALGFIWTNLDEYLLMFSYRGDVNGRHNLPSEPMLAFGVAALAALGFLFCLSRPHRPVPFLLLVWFFMALLPGLVTLPFEAPNTLRAIGTLPVAYLFAGVGIAALGIALAPLLRGYAPLALGVPLVAGMGVIAYDGFNTYFHLQRHSFDVWAAFNPVQTTIAYRILELPSRNYDVQLAQFLAPYPVITFLVPDGPRIETFNPAKHPPASTHGDGALLFLDSGQEPFLSRIEAFYPQQSYSRVDFGQGPRQPLIYTVELDGEDIDGSQGLTARFTPMGTSAQAPYDAQVPWVYLDWGEESAPTPPYSVEWRGTLYVPKFESYKLILEGSPEAQLYLDGSPALEAPGEVLLPLALGSHTLLVKEEVAETSGRTRLLWEPPQGQASVIGPENLYIQGQAHGLLGSYFPPGFPSASGAFQQIDPMVFYFFHHRPFSGEFSIQWDGMLEIRREGVYRFQLDSSGPATMSIDGGLLIENLGISAGSLARHETSRGEAILSPGLHPIRLTFQHRYGSPQIYLHWSPPYESLGPLPWDRLYPASPRLWTGLGEAP